MIKSNELRVGIWVKFKRTTSVDENNFCLNTFMLCNLLNNPYDLSRIEGIPITEDWASRFGFTARKDEILNKVTFRITEAVFPSIYIVFKGNKMKVVQKGFGCEMMLKVYYIHQLQNLYLTLTNEDLTIINI